MYHVYIWSRIIKIYMFELVYIYFYELHFIFLVLKITFHNLGIVIQNKVIANIIKMF